MKDYSDRIITPFVHVWSKKILPTLKDDRMSESEKLIKTKGISKVGHQEFSNGDVKMRKMTKGVKQKPRPLVHHDNSNGISRTTFIGDKNNTSRTSLSFSNFVFSKSNPRQNQETNPHKVKSFINTKNQKIDNPLQVEDSPQRKLKPNQSIEEIRKINHNNNLSINKKKIHLPVITPRVQHMESRPKT